MRGSRSFNPHVSSGTHEPSLRPTAFRPLAPAPRRPGAAITASAAPAAETFDHRFLLSLVDKPVFVLVDEIPTRPGIPEDYRTRIFEKFSQADSSDTRRKGGTGLGLSICKAIVEGHGGELGFETKVGEGTTFYFELPQLCQVDGAVPSVGGSNERG